MAKHSIDKLNELYREGETCDSELFSEMRSNILLKAGHHYKKTSERLRDRFRDVPANAESKLRLVKNHIAKICRGYANALTTHAPDVKIVARIDGDLQSLKAAELNQAVWDDMKYQHRLDAKVSDWAEDFTDLGEVACKVFWDPFKGSFQGYEQEVDDSGAPLYTNIDGEECTDAQCPVTGTPHEPVASKRAVFSGDLQFESILAFNLLRSKNTETMEESPYLIYRKMVDKQTALAMVEAIDDPQEREDKRKFVQESALGTFKVFDGHKGTYTDTKNQVMLREFFFRPCPEYPQGYFYISTQYGILFEGELPFGIFPIVYEGFHKIQTSPRAHSFIRHARPYQAEINRAASKIAETQITLGDDKVILPTGAKLTKGTELPGIRSANSNAGAGSITVIPGRSGEQYFAYLQAQIDELYKVTDYFEQDSAEEGTNDLNITLYKRLSQKEKFSINAKKFERFVVNVARLSLNLAKHYYPDDKVILATGRREIINLPEFKATRELDFTIEVAPVTEDVTSVMGRTMQINQILQYVGQDLPPETRGQLMKNMPFLNDKEMFSDLTQDYENVLSDILALDRGEYRPPNRYDNHAYVIKRLISRIKAQDFRTLAPNIQQMYAQKLQEHEQMQAQVLQQEQALKDGFIPSGGALIKVDYYVNDPKNPGKLPKRALIPAQSVDWLIQRLASQGSAVEQLQAMGEGAQADISQLMPPQQPQTPQPPNQQMNMAQGNAPQQQLPQQMPR